MPLPVRPAIIATATVVWHADGDSIEGVEEPEDVSQSDPDENLILGDANGWVGARVFDVPAGARIKVEFYGDGWLKPSRAVLTIEEAADEVIVMPKGIF